jgi:hypothetical protein
LGENRYPIAFRDDLKSFQRYVAAKKEVQNEIATYLNPTAQLHQISLDLPEHDNELDERGIALGNAQTHIDIYTPKALDLPPNPPERFCCE